MIKLREFDGEKFIDHQAESVSGLKWLVEDLKGKFKSALGDKDDRTGRYESYCAHLDKIVDFYTHKHLKEDYLCKVCSPEDHEKEFCRCESRNMRIAKLNREVLKDNKGELTSKDTCERDAERLSERAPKGDAIV
jgi:hypothetical protein